MHRTALAAVALLIALAACSGSSASPGASESTSSPSAPEASVSASQAPSEEAAASEPAAGHGGAVHLSIDTAEYAGNYVSEFSSGDCAMDGSTLTIDLGDRQPSYDNETTLLDSVSIRIENLLDAIASTTGTGDFTALFGLTRDSEPGAQVIIGSGIEGYQSATAENDVLATGTILIEGTSASGESVTATITCYGVPLG